jgi:hypothetical protein
MSEKLNERIDDMCLERFGHAHWARVDTLTRKKWA